MLPILDKHAVGGAFDADEVTILTQAFDQAWRASAAVTLRSPQLNTLPPSGTCSRCASIEMARLG
jgi:hypothetical protein